MEHMLPITPTDPELAKPHLPNQFFMRLTGRYNRRALLKGLAAIGVGNLLGGCGSAEDDAILDLAPIPDGSTELVRYGTEDIGPDGIDLVGQEWQMPGAEQRGATLHISPAPITIVNAKGDKDQPVLHFNTGHSFRSESGLRLVSDLTLGEGNTKASVLLAETLPLIYDEFTFPGKGLRVTVSDKTGSLEIWDGQHQLAKRTEFALNQTGVDKRIAVQKLGDKITVMINGQPVKEIDGFTGQRLWLGLEAKDGNFDIGSLTVSPINSQKAAVAHADTLTVAPFSAGLRTLAERKNPHCKIGTAVAVAPLLDNEKYAALVAGNFNSITTENALKPQFVQPQEGVFHTEEMRPIITFAETHGIQIHGHALLPNRSLPRWMRDLPTDTSEDKLRIKQVMVDHITGVLKRFPMLASVDLINEPLDDRSWRKDTIWHRAMGDEYIDIALQAAYETTKDTNPNLVLVINENATDKDDARDEARFNLLLDKIVKAKKPGMHVAMGFEGHVYKLGRDEMSPEALARRMDVLAKHDIGARVSEMDVTTHQGNDTTPRGLGVQAEQFGSIARVCMNAPNCISFTMWGIGGKYVSTAGVSDNGQLSWGSNLPWDNNLNQRPATYRALQSAFS